MNLPSQYGPYLLLERVSVGGMAEVYKAKEYGVEGFERTVAVKRILPHVAEDDEFIAMFKDEAKIAVQLNHGNIAQIYNLGNEQDSFYIALEYVAGRDLRAIFQRAQQQGQPMPVAQACYIIMKICEGLDYAHNKKDKYNRPLSIVHRDVSPPNILVSFEGEVKLIDFGVAKAAGRASRTQAGILKGKFGYMSPEQVRGMPLDRRSDVFSVGVVLFEILCGQRLFQAETDFATLEKVRAVDVPRPSAINPGIPKPLENIIFKALTREPEQRYQSAIELHDELQAFMFAQGLFYSRKDLAAWMRDNYAREIEAEKEKAAAQADLRPEQFKANGRGRSAGPPPPPGGGPPPPPPPRGRAGRSPQPATAAHKSVDIGGRAKPPKRKTQAMITSRNLPPPTGGARRPGARGAAPPDPPTIPITSLPKPGGALPKPGRPKPKPVAAGGAAGSASDFDWDDDELETRLFADEEEEKAAQEAAAAKRTSSPGDDAPTRIEIDAKPLVPSVIPAPGVAASTDPGPDKGMTMVPGNGFQPLQAPPGGMPQMQHMPPISAPEPSNPSPLGNQMGAAPGMPGAPGMVQHPNPMSPQQPMQPPVGFGGPTMAAAGAPGMGPHGAPGMGPGPGMSPYDFDDRPRKSNVGPIVVIVIALLVLFGAGLGGIYVMLKDRDKKGGSEQAATDKTEQPVKDEGAAKAGPATPGALSIQVMPADAKVLVDGKELTGSSPYTSSVAPGKHTVKITHDTHLDYETEVEVTEAGLSLPLVTLQPKAVKLSFELVPAEAKASLLSGGQVVGSAKNGEQVPVVRKPNVEYEVEVSAPGYTSLRQPVTFDGEPTQTVTVKLVKAAGADPPPETTTTTKPEPNTTTSSKPKPKPKPKPRAKTATLKIGTNPGVPPAKVSVDGKYVGTTPIKSLPVTAGKHTVKWTWTSGRAAVTQSHTLTDGQTKLVKGG